ncbi:MAG TPA: amidohydrolase family protein [Acidimicrobiales bacterium]|nr:amidohydrolase family protein [Acidimicrobiales bacterium]
MPAPFVVDADGHVLEPADLWERNLPARLRAGAIRMRWNAETGFDERFVEDRLYAERGVAGLGNAGESYADFGRGTHYADLNPAGFDPSERIKVLDAEGIDVSVLYPGLGLALGGIRDPELAVASCRVYNEWIASYAAADPTRLVGVGAVPLQDPEAAVDEVQRIVDLGLRAGFTRPNPSAGRPLHDRTFDRVYAAMAEARLPLAFHPAGLPDVDGAAVQMGGLMAPGTHHALILFFDDYLTLSNLVYGGVLERHPELKVAVLECGGGWIGHWIDRLDEFYESYEWTVEPRLSMRPSDYFRRQCVVSFDPGEHTAPLLHGFAGEGTFIWASDFPHSDAKYPGVVEELLERTADMEPGARAKLVGGNAVRLYGLEHIVR